MRQEPPAIYIFPLPHTGKEQRLPNRSSASQCRRISYASEDEIGIVQVLIYAPSLFVEYKSTSNQILGTQIACGSLPTSKLQDITTLALRNPRPSAPPTWLSSSAYGEYMSSMTENGEPQLTLQVTSSPMLASPSGELSVCLHPVWY